MARTASTLFHRLTELGLSWRAVGPAGLDSVAEVAIEAVVADSRKAGPGAVFVALLGSRTDGHQYVAKAQELGSPILVVAESRMDRIPNIEAIAKHTVVIAMDDTYTGFSALNHSLYGEAGSQLTLVGVTGTNGKTTVTHLIEQMLLDHGQRVGLIGTLGVRAPKGADGKGVTDYASTGHTTPLAEELHRILADMKADGLESVVMEVSSHALEQHRAFGCDFQVGVFTNLTQDHLDYHQTMDAYAEAKALLFRQLNPATGPKAAVINLDDPEAQRFIDATPDGVRLITYAIDASEATLRATDLTYDITGSRFTLVTPEGRFPVQLKLGGRFSVYNTLAALGAGVGLGLPIEECIAAVSKVEGVRGRFEVVSHAPFVIVDYAHTPDGLKNVLEAARNVTPESGKLWVVFGCGGDRDATKRPQMGRLAEQLADGVVVTSDNPRTEDPQQIITDIMAGIQHFDPKTMVVIPDRRQAIRQAMDLAGPHDLIVVAGKGHEDYQILATETIHFDDREEVQQYAATKASGAASPA